MTSTIERTTNFQLPIPPSGKTPWQSYYSEAVKVLDSIVGRFIAIGGFLGAWQNSTAYTVGQKLVDTANGITYQCVVTHTSAASPTTFAQDRAARATLWTTWSSTAISAGVWQSGRSYAVGEFVAKDPKWAVCILAHTSTTSFDNDVAAGKWSVLVDLTNYSSIIVPLPVASGGTGSTVASGARANLGLVIGTDVQAQNANLATVAAYSDVANLSVLQGYTAPAMANLTAFTGLTGAADKVPYFTGAGTATVTTLSAFVRTLLDDADAATFATTLGAPLLASANTFTADQTIQSSDVGAGEGPVLALDRNSASPAAADLLGAVTFKGRDDGGGIDTYAKIVATLVDSTAASEDGSLLLQTAVAGALATRAAVGQGLVVGAPTGGDQGTGTINAQNYFKNGVALGVSAYTARAKSGLTAWADSSAVSFTHGMGARAKGGLVFMQCTTAEGNYAVGDQVLIGGSYDAGIRYAWIVIDSDTVIKAIMTTKYEIPNKTTFASFTPTAANWSVFIECWT